MSKIEDKVLRKIIFGVVVAIGILTFTALIWLGVIILENNGGISGWRAESILASIVLAGTGYLGYMTKKFMDTRSSQEKDDARQARLIEKNAHKERMKDKKFAHKLEKYKWKLKQVEILHTDKKS